MAKSANMFGFFLDEMHKAGGASSSSSPLSSADFSAALDFALQSRAVQDQGAEKSNDPDVVSTIMRHVIQAEPEYSDVVTLANATGLGIDAIASGLDRAVDRKLLKIVSPKDAPAEYARTDFAKRLKV